MIEAEVDIRPDSPVLAEVLELVNAFTEMIFPSPKEAYVRWELNTMEPGESMWVAPEDARSAKQAVRQRAKALGVNEFIVQKLEWGSSYRITRLEPPQLRGLRSHGGG